MPLSIADMTRVEFDAQIASSAVLIPVGATEQHGPHLPLDTDQAIANAFASALARETGVLTAPGINYGCRSHPVSGGGEFFKATISISGRTMIDVMSNIITSYSDAGCRQFAFVNGHFENAAFLVDAAHEIVRNRDDLKVLVINWWEVAQMAVLESIFDGGFPGWEAEHAGIVETSLMMYLDGNRVHIDQIEDRLATIKAPSYTVVPERAGLVDPSGVLQTAVGSSVAIGQGIFEHCMQQMADILRTEFALGQSK